LIVKLQYYKDGTIDGTPAGQNGRQPSRNKSQLRGNKNKPNKNGLQSREMNEDMRAGKNSWKKNTGHARCPLRKDVGQDGLPARKKMETCLLRRRSCISRQILKKRDRI
jgi:hypothetical protein